MESKDAQQNRKDDPSEGQASAILIHTAMAIAISPSVIKCIDQRQRAFLWRGSETAAGGHFLLAWPRVCRPMSLGGLGIPNMQLFEYALRLRWLWMVKSEDARPWSTLPDNVEPAVAAMFASTSMQVGDGRKSLFWTDRWLNGRSIAEMAPSLVQAVGTRIQKKRPIREALQNRRWVRDISGALTVKFK